MEICNSIAAFLYSRALKSLTCPIKSKPEQLKIICEQSIQHHAMMVHDVVKQLGN